MPILPTSDGTEDEHELPRSEPNQDVIDVVVELEKHLAFAYPVNLGPPEAALVRYVTWDRGPISFLATHNLGPDWDKDRIERACKRAVMMFKLVRPVSPESTVPEPGTPLWSHMTLTEAGYALADKMRRETQSNSEQVSAFKHSGKEITKKRGPPTTTDPKADKRIADAWATRQYHTHDDCAKALDLKCEDVKKALDRHRHRHRGNK